MEIKAKCFGKDIMISGGNEIVCYTILSRLQDALDITDFSFCIKDKCHFYKDCINKGKVES